MKYYPLIKLDIQTERDLIKRAQNGDSDAQNQLIMANINLIYKWAIRVQKIYPGYNGWELDDIANIYVIAFIRTIQKFDLTKKNKLSTYAGWIIKNILRRYLVSNALLKVPFYTTGNQKVEQTFTLTVSSFMRYMENGKHKYKYCCPIDPEDKIINTLENASTNEMIQLLHNAIDRLPEHQKLVIKGYLQNKPFKDITMEQGASKQTISDRYQRAMKRLGEDRILAKSLGSGG